MASTYAAKGDAAPLARSCMTRRMMLRVGVTSKDRRCGQSVVTPRIAEGETYLVWLSFEKGRQFIIALGIEIGAWRYLEQNLGGGCVVGYRNRERVTIVYWLHLADGEILFGHDASACRLSIHIVAIRA